MVKAARINVSNKLHTIKVNGQEMTLAPITFKGEKEEVLHQSLKRNLDNATNTILKLDCSSLQDKDGDRIENFLSFSDQLNSAILSLNLAKKAFEELEKENDEDDNNE